jgi:hypothetical protein
MACVNQTRPHCVNQIGKTQSKPLAERHGVCESALILAVVLHRRAAWSLTLREEHRRSVFENRELRRVFGSNSDEVTR